MRLGLLGGSFNPPHVGHLRLAIEVREALGLDRVDLVPAAVQPLKHGGDMLPFERRTRLLDLAVAGVPGLAVNPLEAERPGPSYTVDTLTILAGQAPGADLHLIMGAENLLKLPLWHRGLDLPGLTNLAVVGREDVGPAQVAEALARFWPLARPEPGEPVPTWRFPQGTALRFLPIRRLDVSSTDIRDRWRRGASLRFLLPEAVERELEEGKEWVAAAWGQIGVA